MPASPVSVYLSPLLLLCFSVWTPCAVAQDERQVHIPERAEDFHLFILAGQSNMAGRGEVEDIDTQSHPRVLALDMAGGWVPAVDPLHFDKPAMVGVGPGRTFGLDYAEAHPEVTVGLIPCAAGGSPIDSWTPGGFHQQTQSHPLDDCLSRTKIALKHGRLRGILWHQGESNAKPGLAHAYESKLEELIERLRAEFESPQLPVLIGQLGQFEEVPWTPEKFFVDRAHRKVAERLPHTEFVSTNGLGHKGDRVHFDAASARELGHRYFQALRWLRAKQPRLTLAPGNDNPRNSEGDFVQLSDGRILFVYTRFRGGSSDHDAAELVSRVSRDGGATWSDSDQPVLANEGEWNVMSVSLLRLADGRIALFYMRKNSLSDCRPVVRFSSDEGQSWSEPQEIIPDGETGYYVLNNDRVVQLEDGRLLVPVALHNRPGEEKPDWSGEITVYYSDDQGQNWQRSKTLQRAFSPDGTRIMAQEPGVVPLKDGRLLMWIRTDAGWQYRCYSEDRGETWSSFEPMELASPRSPASIERIPSTGDLLSIWNDHGEVPEKERRLRTPLSAAISRDDGATWSNPVTLSSAPDGWYCYTAVEFLDDSLLVGHCAGKQAPGLQLATTVVRKLPLELIYRRAGLPCIVHVDRIWDLAKHNAFTDLIRFNDRWYCVFREGTGHVSPDGALRVIQSSDGKDWSSAALITNEMADLRDAKLSITPDNQVMLLGAGAKHDRSEYSHQSTVWFSKNGTDWTPGIDVGDRDYWLWRTVWFKGMAYGIAYRTNSQNDRDTRLYRSGDGRHFETLVPSLFDEGYPNESSLVFLEDGRCYCLLRRDGGSKTGQLGIADPPYLEWAWKDLGVRIGGPEMIRLPDGRLIAAVRLYDGQVRTSLCWVDAEEGEITEFLSLPSGGDTSYAGMVWHNDHLWVSYYSAHEAQQSDFATAIYLAKVAIP